MSRNSDLAKIHIAKKQLGMDDETYRVMLRLHGSVDSSKDLDPAGAAKVLAHLNRCGFKVTAKQGKRPVAAPGCGELMSKIEAQLADAGRPWSYVDSMSKRMFAVDKVSWLNSEQLMKIVAALAYDANRRAKAAK